jgi:hypothetical protein
MLGLLINRAETAEGHFFSRDRHQRRVRGSTSPSPTAGPVSFSAGGAPTQAQVLPRGQELARAGRVPGLPRAPEAPAASRPRAPEGPHSRAALQPPTPAPSERTLRFIHS